MTELEKLNIHIKVREMQLRKRMIDLLKEGYTDEEICDLIEEDVKRLVSLIIMREEMGA